MRQSSWRAPDIHEHGGMFRGNPRMGVDLEIYAGLSRREIVEKYPDSPQANQAQERLAALGGKE